ncbi:helix-turn-helix domain-containing protein (plasmid) [Alicyclobacillus sp. TC]|nr:helix-turn-helix domain-containing protein [Alicyclobacillus sp. TC]
MDRLNSTNTSIEKSPLEIIWGTRLLDEGFLGIPNIIVRNYRKLGIEHGEFGLLCCILTYKHDYQDPYPSHEKIADHLQCSTRQVRKWIDSLESKNLLMIGRRRNKTNKQLGTMVYNFKPLIDSALKLVGEHPLPNPVDDWEVEYQKPVVPEVPLEPQVPVGPNHPVELEIPVGTGPEVPLNRSLNRSINNKNNNNAHARAIYIDITVENQEAEEKDFSTSTLFSDMPTSSSSSPSNTMKDYDWDKNENPETIASLEMNQEPIYTMIGQAALEPIWEEIPNPKEPNHTDFHSQVVEPACQAFEQKIMIYLGRPFVVREEDYRKLVSLLASGVPKTFILEGMDHAFKQFELYHPGKKLRAPAAYCLAVIESQWELELAKRSEPTLISFETKANNGDQATTHQRSRTSYRSNDVHLSINSPKPKDPRYPAFYELFPDG